MAGTDRKPPLPRTREGKTEYPPKYGDNLGPDVDGVSEPHTIVKIVVEQEIGEMVVYPNGRGPSPLVTAMQIIGEHLDGLTPAKGKGGDSTMPMRFSFPLQGETFRISVDVD
jgi:hypothetical protein